MIGIFDSGLGGLTVFNEIQKRLPCYDYVYLGDCARAPYGGKSQETIYNYAMEAVDFLFSRGCELVIFACNTASAKALRHIQQEYLPDKHPGKKVLGVVVPVVESIINEENKNHKVGIIGTKATIESGVYEQELRKRNFDKTIYTKATPLLVPLIEEGWIKKKETKMILKKYLKPLKEKNIDILILGCTHYPFLLKKIKRIMPKQCKIIDTPKTVAEKLDDYLKRHAEVEEKIIKNKKISFYTTDNSKIFRQIATQLFGKRIDKIKKVKI